MPQSDGHAVGASERRRPGEQLIEHDPDRVDVAYGSNRAFVGHLLGGHVEGRPKGVPLRRLGFVVLKAPDVPSVLMELGFLSNRQDEAALKRKSYRAKLIAAMARASDAYFSRIEEAVRP